MKRKIIFIGDVHGRIEVIEFVKKQFPDHLKIFTGDFVDAFDRTRKQQVECVKEVLSMIDKGNTRAIFGNHELSYLVREMRCSGWASTMDTLLLPLKNQMWKKFETHIWMPEHKLLITHAGLTKYLWQEYRLTVDKLGGVLEGWSTSRWYQNPLSWIGRSRGGIDPVGGIFWCDFNDEFVPVPEIRQVFGHTGWVDPSKDATGGIRERSNENFCIDCFNNKAEFLEFDPARETTQFKILRFDRSIIGSTNVEEYVNWEK